MKKQIQVVAALFLEGKRLALFQRKPSESWPEVWEFPGGKIESGESPEQALHREIQEELGIQIEVLHDFGVLSHDYDHAIIHLQLFHVRGDTKNIILIDHSQWDFFSLEQSRSINLAKADVPFLSLIEEYIRKNHSGGNN